MAIESRYDVNTLRAGGIRIWPLIRLRISQLLFNVDESRGNEIVSRTPEKKRLFALPKKIASASHRLLTDFQSLSMMKKSERPDVMLVESPDFTREIFPEGAYDRQVDSMLEFAARNYSVLKVGFRPPYGPSFGTEAFPVLRLGVFPYLLAGKLLRYNSPIEGFEKFLACVDEVCGNRIYLSEDDVLADFRVLLAYRRFYDGVLAKVRPRLVLFSTFWAIPNMALSWAVRGTGAVSADIQHGMQGIDHALYSNWTKLPANGYELLPDYYWVWGKECVDNILRFRQAPYSYHEPIVGGNLWLMRWLREPTSPIYDQEFESLKNRARDARKIVMVALQPIHNRLPEPLIGAMKKSPHEWFWFVRVHPQQRADLLEIKRQIEERGIINFEIELSTRLPLYFLLGKAQHFVTVWSSSVYEALAMRLPVTVMTKEGAEAFRSYLELGLLDLAHSADELLASVAASSYPRATPEPRPYIETDERIAAEALAFLLRKSEST